MLTKHSIKAGLVDVSQLLDDLQNGRCSLPQELCSGFDADLVTEIENGLSAVPLGHTVEPGEFKAGEQSLAFVTVELVDTNGNRVPTAEIPAKASVTGAATLQAFAAAKPDTAENYTSGVFTSYQGRWQAVLRSGTDAGQAVLRVEAEGFAAAEITLTCAD